MSKIKTTFDELWREGLEGDAKSLGVIDGDLHKVRSKVRNVLIRAGWSDKEGHIDFVSDNDAANALQAARKELNKVSETVVNERRIVSASSVPGMAPSKAEVLSASVEGFVPSEQAVLESTNTVTAGSFQPKMGKVGDACPRCHSQMTPVGLVNGKAALFCTRDRVVLPMAQDTQVRY